MENKFLKLNPGREKSLLRRHVWIFSGAVADYPGEAAPGETVEVFDAKNNFLARAAYSPDSQLIARVWTFDRDEQIDEAFFARRIKAAVEYRHFLKLDDPKGGCRLINSEADGLPGLVVDRYAGVLVIQITSAGIEFHRDTIVKLLAEITGAASIYERSDVSVRAKEGLAERSGLLYGAQPPNPVIIEENGARFAVDVRHGQKSGFYFDQRCARAVVAAYADGRTVLNAFSYTGAFAVSALLAGAEHVINIDSSAPALKQAAHNLEMNRIKPERYENRTADVFTELRRLVEEGRKFDLVILDPPKFIESQKALVRGCRAYQDIARLGYRLLNPGGLLFNFSCSGLMTPELFQKITADAALDAGVRARLVRHLEQAPDHPVSLAVPEGFYLKGLVTRIDAE
ncbi:class I SAM-dependent rRNA methyltransferase [Victivallis vadensis]|uniref:SAM-dependent methyltransferase /23S rRNA m(5)C-1962 methyltransferase n=1 Tax=Victivallis vadensis TaxID=172901 RepID=A0A2U1APX4_9BACT|nr:class I SAM-dependent methyltransferase [Victivallis vadensis]PVY38464.1 SAM-dependent methyltransferase /23S rRNA m(5)C-1962 methyltransferase [Victivallis vadensis]